MVVEKYCNDCMCPTDTSMLRFHMIVFSDRDYNIHFCIDRYYVISNYNSRSTEISSLTGYIKDYTLTLPLIEFDLDKSEEELLNQIKGYFALS